jgi:hypothetical protein
VYVLSINRQYKAFKCIVQIVVAIPKTDLICNIALSLVHLEPRSVARYASYLMSIPTCQDAQCGGTAFLPDSRIAYDVLENR